MRLSLGLLAMLAAAAATQPQTSGMPSRAANESQPAHTVVRFGHVWDGAKLIDNAVVTIDGDTITSVESGGRVPADALDMTRYTAIPGLIDLHTHITYYWDRKPGTRPLGQPRRRPAVTVYLAQDNARRTLETGVTTIRDVGASGETDYAMRDLVAMDAMPGPRMFVAGQGISAGRGWTPDPAALAKQAEERIKAGSDWVKVYASRGSFDSVETTQTLTFDELKAIVDAAHALNHKVAIHSYAASAARGLHRKESRIDQAGVQRRREAGHGIRCGLYDVRPEHARARVVRQGRH